MALLTAAQKAGLANLAQAKAEYDLQEENTKRGLAERREARKDVLRELVRLCVEDKTPVRQIHMTGMGFAQANQMRGFFAPPAEGGMSGAVLDWVSLESGNSVGVPAVEPKLPALRWENNAVWWMEDGVEKYTARRSIDPLYGRISQMKFDKLSEFAQKVVLGDRTFRCLIEDEAKQYIEDGTVPDRYKD